MTTDTKPNIRHAFGRYATGIAVITTLDAEGHPYGLTINSFASVSLTPPLISWNVIRDSNAHVVIQQAPRFVVNVLGRTQQAIAQKMIGPIASRFDGLTCDWTDDGLPVLPDTLATFECTTHALVTAGDHDIVLGQVNDYQHHDGEPLVYWQGRYASITPSADKK